MKKVYTHTSLRRSDFYRGIIGLLIFAGLIFLINYLFFSVEESDFKPLIGPVFAITLIVLLRLQNLVVITDLGIKAYGLFYRERFIAWENVKHLGFINKGWTVKQTDTPGKGDVFVILTELDNEDLISNLKTKHVIQLPYRKDVYELIKSKAVLVRSR